MEVQNQIYRSIKGDYIGFTFGGIHSSELGLLRVSDGSRYNTDLLPPLQDKTVQVSGRDGAVYFNSTYNTKPIKVPVAFDNMNEESFQKLKRLLADKKPKYLWFDETPYKQWLVKSATAQSFKWVCFDETNIDGEKRRYKGEGTLEFNCFTPYAESRVQFLDDPVDYVWVWNRDKSPKRLIKKYNSTKEEILRKKISKTINNNQSSIVVENNIGNEYSNYIPTQDPNKKRIYQTKNSKNEYQFEYRPEKIYNNLIACTIQKNLFYIRENDKEDFLKWINGEGENKTWSFYRFDKLVEEENELEVKSIVHETDKEPSIFSISFIDQDTNQEKEEMYCVILCEEGENNYTILKNGENGKTFSNENLTLVYYYLNKAQEEVTLSDNYNFLEWEKISNLKNEATISNTTTLSNTESEQKTKIVYNAGDIPTHPQIIFKEWNFKTDEKPKKVSKIVFTLYKQEHEEDEEIGGLKLKPLKKISPDDYGIIIDSKLKMIKGIDNTGKLTGSVYNKYHTDGDFFNIPVQESDENYYITVRYIFLNEDNQEIEDNPEYLTGYDVKYTHYYI